MNRCSKSDSHLFDSTIFYSRGQFRFQWSCDLHFDSGKFVSRPCVQYENLHPTIWPKKLRFMLVPGSCDDHHYRCDPKICWVDPKSLTSVLRASIFTSLFFTRHNLVLFQLNAKQFTLNTTTLLEVQNRKGSRQSFGSKLYPSDRITECITCAPSLSQIIHLLSPTNSPVNSKIS